MRLRLKTLAPWLASVLGAMFVVWAIIGSLQADDRVTIRGNYYREVSTRVLQPLVIVHKDVPDERLTIGASYMLDAISSASIAAGAAAVTGGDNVFTEIRHETTATVASRLPNWTLGGFFRYSTESDYISRSFGFSVARDLFQRAGTLSVAYSANLDRTFQIRQSFRDTVPWTSADPDDPDATNLVQIHYLSLGYSHALHRTLLAGAVLEGIYATGPQDNPYRRIDGALNESHPHLRRRLAMTGFLRWAVLKAHMVVEPRYRFYHDDWGITAHAIDPRIHFRVAKHLRLRLRYRFYHQTKAYFFLPMDERPYPADAEYISADPKMSRFLSHTPGLQLVVELDGLARYNRLKWLRGAFIEATYNHVFQTNRFGAARLGNLTLSIPF